MYQNEIENNIKKLLKYDKGTDNSINNIFNYINEHTEFFVWKFWPWFVKHFEIAFDSIIEAVQQINFESKKNWPEHRWTQRLIIKNNLPTLFSSYNLLISGFYVDSMTLIRSLFESVIKIIYISHYPEEKDWALLYNVKWTKKFNITSFQKDILKVDWHYKLLSSNAHSSWYKTIKDLINISQNWQKNLINMELWRNDDELSMTLNWLEFIIWNYLFFTKEYLLKNNKDFYLKLTNIEKGFYSMFYSLSISHPTNTFYQKCNEAIKVYEDINDKEKTIKKVVTKIEK